MDKETADIITSTDEIQRKHHGMLNLLTLA